MAYDKGLVERVRDELREKPGYVEKKMFGGVGFMLQGNMAGGVLDSDLIVRVGREAYEDAMAEPHTEVFYRNGRPMTGWVVVTPEGYADDADLKAWVERAAQYALSLPSK